MKKNSPNVFFAVINDQGNAPALEKSFCRLENAVSKPQTPFRARTGALLCPLRRKILTTRVPVGEGVFLINKERGKKILRSEEPTGGNSSYVLIFINAHARCKQAHRPCGLLRPALRKPQQPFRRERQGLLQVRAMEPRLCRMARLPCMSYR